MDEARLRRLLADVRAGRLPVAEAIERLRDLPFAEVAGPAGTGPAGPVARPDRHRTVRTGLPEAIYAEGKTPDEVGAIAAALLEGSDRLLVTRADEAHAEAVRAVAPDAERNERARTVVVLRGRARPRGGRVVVVAAGTSDLPVAEEAFETVRVALRPVERLYDVGVAGLHRLVPHLPRLRRAAAIVVAAGMEGALPSVVAGLVGRPVVAVPTSVGYGASFGGLASLLGMLNACAPGVTVVNIDNGFGAGCVAAMIAAPPRAAGPRTAGARPRRSRGR